VTTLTRNKPYLLAVQLLRELSLSELGDLAAAAMTNLESRAEGARELDDGDSALLRYFHALAAVKNTRTAGGNALKAWDAMLVGRAGKATERDSGEQLKFSGVEARVRLGRDLIGEEEEERLWASE
jgi:hypothetical protein